MRFYLCRAFFFVVASAAPALLNAGCAARAAPPAAAAPAVDPPGADDVARPESPRVLRPFEGIEVPPGDRPSVEIAATTCLDRGWLEQIACAPESREHESLVVVQAKPSEIHAALLLAGFTCGAPGRWSYVDDDFAFTPPQGEALAISVRSVGAAGERIEEPVRTWIADHQGRHEFPDAPWIFGGSRFAPNPEWAGPGEHYVADMTGSVIGLVTFGDETIGFSRVIADSAAVQAPQWTVRTDHVPPVGTGVTLVVRRAE